MIVLTDPPRLVKLVKGKIGFRLLVIGALVVIANISWLFGSDGGDCCASAKPFVWTPWQIILTSFGNGLAIWLLLKLIFKLWLDWRLARYGAPLEGMVVYHGRRGWGHGASSILVYRYKFNPRGGDPFELDDLLRGASADGCDHRGAGSPILLYRLGSRVAPAGSLWFREESARDR